VFIVTALAFCFFLSNCESQVLLKNDAKLSSIGKVAIVGFPGQCIYQKNTYNFISVIEEKLKAANRYTIVSPEIVNDKFNSLNLHKIEIGENSQNVNIQDYKSLVTELGLDALIIGFYTPLEKTSSSSPGVGGGLSVSMSYTSVIPCFETIIIDRQGEVIFQVKTKDESAIVGLPEKRFYGQMSNALQKICDALFAPPK